MRGETVKDELEGNGLRAVLLPGIGEIYVPADLPAELFVLLGRAMLEFADRHPEEVDALDLLLARPETRTIQ
jgi:hypothetical protein